jgi:hypothetical protein
MKALKLLAIAIALLICACTDQRPAQLNVVLTVDQLVDSAGKYASKIVDVRGEVIMDYHGPTLVDLEGKCGFFIFLPENIDPKPGFELVKDKMYEEYERLSYKPGGSLRQPEDGKLIATIRGRYDLLQERIEDLAKHPWLASPVRHRFVLHRVLKLEVQNSDQSKK